MVPWEEWGPSAARIITPSSFQWITAHAGQRWLSLESDKLVLRDFSAARVRRALAAAAARARQRRSRTSSSSSDLLRGSARMNAVYNGDGSRSVSPAKIAAVLGGAGAGASSANNNSGRLRTRTRTSTNGRGCFAEPVVSELPFLEMCVDAPGRAGSMVLTDGAWLVAFVRTVSINNKKHHPSL
jgi:hypothetical protein